MTGTELKELRTSTELSQAAFAAMVGVTVTTVSRWENGVHPIGRLAATSVQADVRAFFRRQKNKS